MEFAASVTALTSLVLEIGKSLHKYSDMRSSSQDIESLLAEVDALFKVLKQLELFLRDDTKGRQFDQATSVLGSTTSACKTTLTDLKRRLESLSGKLLGNLAWPFHKEHLQNLAESLRRYNQIFQFSLTIEGWYDPGYSWFFQLLNISAESLRRHQTTSLQSSKLNSTTPPGFMTS